MHGSSLSLDRQAGYFQLTHASPARPRPVSLCHIPHNNNSVSHNSVNHNSGTMLNHNCRFHDGETDPEPRIRLQLVRDCREHGHAGMARLVRSSSAPHCEGYVLPKPDILISYRHSGRKLRRHQRVRRLIERQGINMTAHVTVTVWGKPHVVTVYQKSKSEWIVAGQYKDKQIQVTDSGYNAAIKRWREAATDRGK